MRLTHAIIRVAMQYKRAHKKVESVRSLVKLRIQVGASKQ